MSSYFLFSCGNRFENPQKLPKAARVCAMGGISSNDTDVGRRLETRLPLLSNLCLCVASNSGGSRLQALCYISLALHCSDSKRESQLEVELFHVHNPDTGFLAAIATRVVLARSQNLRCNCTITSAVDFHVLHYSNRVQCRADSRMWGTPHGLIINNARNTVQVGQRDSVPLHNLVICSDTAHQPFDPPPRLATVHQSRLNLVIHPTLV